MRSSSTGSRCWISSAEAGCDAQIAACRRAARRGRSCSFSGLTLARQLLADDRRPLRDELRLAEAALAEHRRRRCAGTSAAIARMLPRRSSATLAIPPGCGLWCPCHASGVQRLPSNAPFRASALPPPMRPPQPAPEPCDLRGAAARLVRPASPRPAVARAARRAAPIPTASGSARSCCSRRRWRR